MDGGSSLEGAYSDTVWNPFMRETTYDPSYLAMQENGADYANYWVQAAIAVTHIRHGELDVARKILDCLYDTFARHGCFPRPTYKDLEEGWVSCMDAPVIAVAAQLFYEKTGEEKYSRFLNELCAYIPSDVTENGFVGQINEKSWFFEYADSNTNEETGWFVLNGSLLGTLATAIIAAVTENQILSQLVEDQTALYKDMMPQFWYSDDSWCLYELNQPSVNMPHYVIFEIRLFDALAEVVGDPFYAEEAQRRRNLLTAQYPLFIYPGKNGETSYLFIRRGPPHYYKVDVYATELIFLDDKGRVLETVFTGLSDLRGVPYVTGTLPEGTAEVKWTSVSPEFRLEIGSLAMQAYQDRQEAPPIPLPITWQASGAGTLNGQELLVTSAPEYDRCNFTGTLPEAVGLLATDIFAIEMENLSEETLANNIVLYDTTGTGVGRYLISLEPGKNLLVFSPMGFHFYRQQEPKDFLCWNLRIYTGEMTGESASLRIGDAYQFKNQKQFYDYLSASDYQIFAADLGE